MKVLRKRGKTVAGMSSSKQLRTSQIGGDAGKKKLAQGVCDYSTCSVRVFGGHVSRELYRSVAYGKKVYWRLEVLQ